MSAPPVFRGVSRPILWAPLFFLMSILGVPGQAQEAPPRVELDRLLELPTGRTYEIEKKAGRTPSEWRRRFTKVREALAEEQKGLAVAEQELEEIAASTEPWQIAPPLPGATSIDAPLDYGLRQKIRRHRSEIERLEGRLLELRVEADLASVPPDWRI